MDHLSVKETAERWGVTVRRVQQLCKAGLIPGAAKFGKSWMVPKDAKLPTEEAKTETGIPDVYQLTPFRQAMPLLCSSYEPGHCIEFIQSLPDEDDQNIALGEYYYFSGQAEKAVKLLEPYLDSHDPALRYSASLVCSFANLSRGHIHLARFASQNLMTQVRTGLQSDSPPKLHAMGVLTATAASVLLHMPLPNVPSLRDFLRYLPGGLKLWGCYVLAHQAYLEKDYAGALAMAEMGLALSPESYPVAEVYTRLVAVMALMNLKQPERARAHMDAAWKLAQPDDLIEPFGEHHGLLQGMIEIYFKNDHPKDFDRIIAITYAFSAGWRKVHNPETKHDVADNLTTTEFTIAMLYSRGWTGKEICSHMGLSERRVRDHQASINGKLGVNRREEIKSFMLI